MYWTKKRVGRGKTRGRSVTRTGPIVRGKKKGPERDVGTNQSRSAGGKNTIMDTLMVPSTWGKEKLGSKGPGRREDRFQGNSISPP